MIFIFFFIVVNVYQNSLHDRDRSSPSKALASFSFFKMQSVKTGDKDYNKV